MRETSNAIERMIFIRVRKNHEPGNAGKNPG
jgi:hypothetical protein